MCGDCVLTKAMILFCCCWNCIFSTYIYLHKKNISTKKILCKSMANNFWFVVIIYTCTDGELLNNKQEAKNSNNKTPH
jgi:hypothetical protein